MKRRYLFVLGVILLSVVLWGSEYFARTLWEPDEARYVYIANEMKADNHWLIPFRNGRYYAHKPPMMFWLQNAAAVTTGGVVNQVSGRLPSLLGAILSLLAISGLASLWKEKDAAWRIVLILPTVYLFWKVAGMGQIDALLCGFEMVALYFLFKSDDVSGSNLHAAFAYLFMGLAVITKGPVGFVVPLGAYITAQVMSGDKSELKKWHFLWGIPLVLLPIGIWLYAAWRHGAPDGYFNELLFKQNIGRAAGTSIHGHHRSIIYFLWHFPLEFMPWTLFLIGSIRALYISKYNVELRKKLIWWIIFVIVLFSLSVTKRNIYILLAYPPAALLIAIAWDDMTVLSEKWRGFIFYGTVGLLALIGLTGFGAFIYSMMAGYQGWQELPLAGWRFLPMALILSVGSIVSWKIYRKDGLTDRWLILFCSMLLINQLAVATIIYPGINYLKSPFAIEKAAKEFLPPGQDLLIYKNRGEILALYSNARGCEIYSVGELRRYLHKQQKGMVVVSSHQFKEIQEEPVLKDNWHFFKMGHKKFYWADFDISGEQND